MVDRSTLGDYSFPIRGQRYAATQRREMESLNMDYDRTSIPAVYDRGRDHGPEVLWMSVIESHVDAGSISTILDLGCGTGRFSEGLASRFGACVVGVDPSEKMLAQARRKRQRSGIHYERGTAEAIPLVAGAVDMIFMSMCFHHFRDPERAAWECRRVLRPDGSVVVRTGTREQIQSYPYVPFFPSTRAMLEDLLPDRPGLCSVFETAGFRCVESHIVMQTIAPSWAAYADKLSAGGDSVLARLDEAELASGLDAVRRYGDGPGGRPIVEPIDVLFFR
jgi:ubiquinone/menaquinone biosynthesis C-methylase UbiE